MHLIKNSLTNIKNDLIKRNLKSVAISSLDSFDECIHTSKTNRYYNNLDPNEIMEIIPSVFCDFEGQVTIYPLVKQVFKKDKDNNDTEIIDQRI